jgi:hypothetical protein
MLLTRSVNTSSFFNTLYSTIRTTKTAIDRKVLAAGCNLK